MHLQCRSLTNAQVVNKINLQPSSQLKIDLIGMAEKMAKISHVKIMATTKKRGIKKLR